MANAIKARLVTRCGCSKEVTVPFPFPRTIDLPLLPRFVTVNAEDTLISGKLYEKRTFMLRHALRDEFSILEAEYVEI